MMRVRLPQISRRESKMRKTIRRAWLMGETGHVAGALIVVLPVRGKVGGGKAM